jgi:predicted dienelactone hydrolase
MRPLEIIIPALLAVYLLWRNQRPIAIQFLPALAFLTGLVHLVLEGYRWQMIPIYILTTFLTLLSLRRIRSSTDGNPLGTILTLILLAVSTALPILLPVPSIPAPDGPYQVGTSIFELTDAARAELYSGKDEPRRFQIQVWYPSEPSSSDQQAHWMNHAEVYSQAISQDILDLPPFFLDHLALARLPAYQDSEVAPTDSGYPVILFSHGWTGFNAQNTGQALQLASHGYIVVGIQHTYGAVVTVFEDGTVARYNPTALPRGAPDAIYDPAADELAVQWAGDIGFALDFMTEQNDASTSRFFHTMDLSHVGVYGHSTGGGAAIQFCGTDERCTAVFGQDPFLRPVSDEILERGVSQPAFFMFSQRWNDDVDSLNNRQFKSFLENFKAALGAVYIVGTAHYDFSDLPLLSQLAPQLGLKGPIAGKRVIAIVDDYLLSFFDATLKGEASALFEGPNRYPEVNQKN